MRWSEERVSHLAHRILESLWRGDLADFPDEGRALQSLKGALGKLVAVEDVVDVQVREKLAKQQKVVGSKDWQILYERYFREEMERRGWS